MQLSNNHTTPKRKLTPQQRCSKKSSFHHQANQENIDPAKCNFPNVHEHNHLPMFSPMVSHREIKPAFLSSSSLNGDFSLNEPPAPRFPKFKKDQNSKPFMHAPLKENSTPSESTNKSPSLDRTSVLEWNSDDNASYGIPTRTPVAHPQRQRNSSLVGGMFQTLGDSLPRAPPYSRTGNGPSGLKALDLLEACGGMQAFPIKIHLKEKSNSDQLRSSCTQIPEWRGATVQVASTPSRRQRWSANGTPATSPSRPQLRSPGGGKSKAVSRVDPSSPNHSQGTVLATAFSLVARNLDKLSDEGEQTDSMAQTVQIHRLGGNAIPDDSSIGSFSEEDVRTVGMDLNLFDHAYRSDEHRSMGSPHNILSMDSDELRSHHDMAEDSSRVVGSNSNISRLLFSPHSSEQSSNPCTPAVANKACSLLDDSFHTAMQDGSRSNTPLTKNLFNSFEEDDFEDALHSPIPYKASPFASKCSKVIRVNPNFSPRSTIRPGSGERRHHVRQRSCPNNKPSTPPYGTPQKSKMNSSTGVLPLPNQDAFEQSSNSSFNTSVCPPTPVRTPVWAMERSSGVFGLERQNSLAKNKLLILNGEHVEHEDIEYSFEDHFEVISTLGSGCSADVYKVLSKDDKNLYAVKKNKNQFKGKRDRDFTLEEMNCLLKLKHDSSPHIIQMFKTWQQDGYCYTQMEYCAGGNLKDFLFNLDPSEKIPEIGLWQIIHDMGQGLLHIHQCGMVHMDIKPENTLISKDGLLKIGDFGSCVEIGNTDDGREGDFLYMPKELLNSSKPKHSSADIYCLGLMLYEVCSRQTLPAEGEAWHALREERAPPLPSDRCSNTLSLLVSKMLASDPFVRPTAVDIVCNSNVRSAGTTSERTFRPRTAELTLDLSRSRAHSAVLEDTAVFTPPTREVKYSYMDVANDDAS
mmetsp:Transcript_8000/g.10636  ORF Transcript_8000/g.10636 Transcript_8000/m.10636 type:complete len:913 (+) Transcript_8000:147-2885(+)